MDENRKSGRSPALKGFGRGLLSALVLVGLAAMGGQAAAENLLDLKGFSRANGWRVGVSKSAKQAGGYVKAKQGTLAVKHPKLETRKYDLQLNRDLKLDIGGKYVFRFEAATTSAAVVEVVYGTSSPPYRTYNRSWIKLTPQKTSYELVLDIRKNAQGAFEPERTRTLRLYFGANPALDLTLTNVSLQCVQSLAISPDWSLFLKVAPPTSYASLPPSLPSRSGLQVSPRRVTLKNNSLDLAALAKGTFQEGDTAILYNEFDCTEAGTMRLGMAADWWMEVHVNGQKTYSTLKGGNKVNTFLPSDHVFDFPTKKGKNLIAVKVLSGSGGWKFVCGVPTPKSAAAPARHTVTFKEGADWKAVDVSSLEVKAGSALDLSALIDAPAGRHGRLVVNRDGEFAFAKDPTQAVRLRGFNGVPRAVWQYHSEEAFEQRARRFAVAARRQGYRILRTNMLECAITSGAAGDMAFNPKYLRRWDFLLAQLKEQGIYVHFVIASYGLYYSPFSFEGEVFKKRNEHKLRMFMGEQSERDHWKFGAEYLLNHVNPYTGLTWKEDPAFAVVEFYNEQENGPRKIPQIIVADPEIRRIVESKWRAWLNRKFKGKPSAELVRELKGVDFANAPIPEMRGDQPELANQFSLFIGDRARANAAWFEKVVRQAGYPGLVTQYNFSKKLVYSAARWEAAQAVEMNGYFCHPYQGEVRQDSSIEKSADYWRGINSTRLAGRPFLVTEFNHAFWNRYQREAGLVFGAYSALQNFGSIMIHSGPVALEAGNEPLKDFTCGSSPIVRANEFLAACLFQRGDVSKALNNLELLIPKSFLNENKNSDRSVNSAQSKLALMTGFSLAFPELPKPQGLPAKLANSALAIAPAGGGQIGGHEWATSVLDSKDGTFSLGDTAAQLKKAGILPKGNISDPDKGIFQSDTGQITMRAKDKLLKVTTPRSEAVCLNAGKSMTLDALRVDNTSVPATVAVCAMDGKPLPTSARLVLVYSTEVANTGMALSYNRTKMIKPGKLPILMKTGKLKATLKNRNAARIALYALGLDGSRREKLPVTCADGSLQLEIDTQALKNGPTSFFELAVE
jgi:hypothetical protein